MRVWNKEMQKTKIPVRQWNESKVSALGLAIKECAQQME